MSDSAGNGSDDDSDDNDNVNNGEMMVMMVSCVEGRRSGCLLSSWSSGERECRECKEIIQAHRTVFCDKSEEE